MKIKVEKRVHKGWTEWQTIPKKVRKTMLFGEEGWVKKWQYIYSSKKGEISLVCLKTGMREGMFFTWEIYCLDTKKVWWNPFTWFKKEMFEDVERFATKKQAEVRINQLLK